jgi:hypothetical protein
MSDGKEELPADDRALERLLRDRRFGPPDPDAVTPWDFARQWSPAVVENRVWPIVSRMMLDADELVRARAVEFVRLWRDGAALTTPRLLEVAERHPSEFGDQRPEGLALREVMAHARAHRRAVAAVAACAVRDGVPARDRVEIVLSEGMRLVSANLPARSERSS